MTLAAAADTAAFIRDNYHGQGNFPNYEDVLEKSYLLFLRPGHKVIDIGAHAGRHTEKFIERVGPSGQIYAFEPLPSMAATLHQRFGRLANVTIEEIAFSNRVGEATYKFVTNAPEESGLRERIYNIPDPIIEEIKVQVSTVDTYFPTAAGFDYVKIDIEGGEIDCLAGMTGFLKRNRPFVSVEYGSPGFSKYGNTAETLFDSAHAHHYCLSDLFGTLIKDRAEWLQVCDVAAWDFFLVPVERQAEWQGYFSNVHALSFFLEK